MDQTAVKPKTGRNGREVCPTCGGNKSMYERICLICKQRLPEVTRAALAVQDEQTERRHQKLFAYANAGLQLEDIRIYE